MNKIDVVSEIMSEFYIVLSVAVMTVVRYLPTEKGYSLSRETGEYSLVNFPVNFKLFWV